MTTAVIVLYTVFVLFKKKQVKCVWMWRQQVIRVVDEHEIEYELG